MVSLASALLCLYTEDVVTSQKSILCLALDTKVVDSL